LEGSEGVSVGPIASIAVPKGLKFGTGKLGDYMHEQFQAILAKAFPTTQFETKLKPGQTGVDVKWIGGDDPGFDFADLKPESLSGLRKFLSQIVKWDDKGEIAGQGALFTYDANGNFYGPELGY
jgi:hypothetical protein